MQTVIIYVILSLVDLINHNRPKMEVWLVNDSSYVGIGASANKTGFAWF